MNDISIVPEDKQFLEETILGPGDISIHPYGFGPGTGFDSAPFLSTYASALPLRFALCTDLCALALRFQAFLEVPRIGASLPSLP